MFLNLLKTAALQVKPEDQPYYFRFFRYDDKLALLVLGVAQKLGVV
ncbi:hypothetical protein DSOL_5404 [Desulfosporosinus metallidurans]|uniref:Uncharacterized protein n=1 Tax=Desulfosporosinus metallidurans TaxID=1888891 RepID=A0A1Q8QBU4_9FIRM|nr:hypothetical protein DSOL_5404 [Desulfosporosinus metallidurans]